MSKRNKTFTYVPRNKEMLEFTVQPENGMEVTFKCVPTMPAGVLIELGEQPDDTSNPLARVANFFRSVLIDSDVARFNELLTSKTYQVPFETLTDVMEWLIEEYTARPTMPPSSSEAGRSTTGNGSTAPSSDSESMLNPSQPIDSVITSTL